MKLEPSAESSGDHGPVGLNRERLQALARDLPESLLCLLEYAPLSPGEMAMAAEVLGECPPSLAIAALFRLLSCPHDEVRLGALAGLAGLRDQPWVRAAIGAVAQRDPSQVARARAGALLELRRAAA